MDASLKNIAMVLVVLSLAFLGYYVFIQKDTSSLALEGNAVSQELFANVQKYGERRNQLDQIKLDTSIFSDELFLSLKGYPREIPDQTIGRKNPFDKSNPTKTNSPH